MWSDPVLNDRWFTTVLGALLALTTVAARADYPASKDYYINDFASVLSGEETDQVRSTLSTLKSARDVEMTVVTIHSVRDYGTGETEIEPFATGLFNQWGIGDSHKNNGILLLVAVKDRALRIELGAGYDGAADAAALAIVEYMLPYFKRQDYGQGIVEGTKAVAQAVKAGRFPLDVDEPATSSTPAPSSNPSFDTLAAGLSQFKSWRETGLGAFIVILIFSGWRQYLRHRARRCANCGTSMQRLGETADDKYLDEGQRLEESLKSVDYDVWLCPSCRAVERHAYRAWFSSYGTCPKCHSRTLDESSRVVQEATYGSTGRRQITEDCRRCDYHNERTEIIPERERSSSSGSSSFSGGHSSGGGASGRW